MKNYTVSDLMVPLSEYATVSEDATLCDAILALEKAQEEFDQTRYRHRAILVFDKNNRIVGKISQLDALKALEPKYAELVTDTRARQIRGSVARLRQRHMRTQVRTALEGRRSLRQLSWLQTTSCYPRQPLVLILLRFLPADDSRSS